MALRDILNPCAGSTARRRPASPPTSWGTQPGPIPRVAGVARRRKRRLGGFPTVSLRSFSADGGAPRQESTPHPPRNFSFSVLKLTDCDNQRGLNQAPSPNCPTNGAELYCVLEKNPKIRFVFLRAQRPNLVQFSPLEELLVGGGAGTCRNSAPLCVC